MTVLVERQWRRKNKTILVIAIHEEKNLRYHIQQGAMSNFNFENFTIYFTQFLTRAIEILFYISLAK